MKYLIIGTGGVGGCLAGFLAQAGREVTCIARGEHKQALKEHGLTLISDLKGTEVTSAVEVYDTEEYISLCQTLSDEQKPDAIIVAVKGYSLESIAEVIRTASTAKTLILPILNVYGTGPRLKELIGETEATILDGCIYIVGFRKEPGVIRQAGRVMKVVMGTIGNAPLPDSALVLSRDMEASGIKVVVSTDIRLDTFMKWGFISAMSATGSFHNCPMGPIQSPGPERDTLTALLRESYSIGQALGLNLPDDYVARNVDIIDHCTPDTTSSMQKDMAAQHQSEIDGQIFSMARLGHRLGVATPCYDEICQRFSRELFGILE